MASLSDGDLGYAEFIFRLSKRSYTVVESLRNPRSVLGEALPNTPFDRFAKLVRYGLADAYTSKPHPPGCLVLNSSLPCSDDAEGLCPA